MNMEVSGKSLHVIPQFLSYIDNGLFIEHIENTEANRKMFKSKVENGECR